MKTPRPTVFCAACFIIANAAQDFFHIMRCNFPRTYADYIESRDCDSVRGSVKHTNARKDILLAALEGVTRVKLGRYDLFLIGSKYIGCDRDYQVLSSVYAHDPIFAGRIVCPVEYHELRHVL